MACNNIQTLLKPRWWGTLNQAKGETRNAGIIKFMIIGGLGAGFWVGALLICLRMLRYFSGVEQLGDILAWKFLSMVIVTIFSLLIFSSILNSLSKLYLAKDLKLVHAMPVEGYTIFLARWLEITLDSSWMVILFTLPVFVSYGVVYDPGLFFYLTVLASLVLLSFVASALGAFVVMGVVILVPASRIRTIFVFLGLSVFILLYVALRILRPERLVDPDVFSATLFYFKSMTAPSSAFLPSTWCYDAVMGALQGGSSEAFFHMGLLLSFVLVMIFVLMFTADLIYFKGVSRAQTSAARLFVKRRLELPLIRRFNGPVKALVTKEIKTFFRDQTQWSQLFLIGALMAIYIYNFKVLPLDRSPIKTIYLQNILSFLNMGLAFFVLTAITGRFAFPAVSMEGEAIWLIRSSPVSPRSFLWIKFFMYLVPLMVLTLMLIIATNLLLKVVPFMMVLSCMNTVLMVPGVVALGIGLGAAFPSFKSENPAQTVTSYGGLLFMIYSAIFIGGVIVLQAGPVYAVLASRFRGGDLSWLTVSWIVLSFTASFFICIMMVVLPLRFGEKRLVKHLYH